MQLHGPVDLGVGCEDLLDQRRARPGKPDDEDRIGRIKAYAVPRCEEVCGAHGDLAVDPYVEVRRAVVAPLLLQGIALGVVVEGAFELAASLECGAEREAQLDAIVLGGGVVGDRGDHLLDLLVREDVRLRIRKRPVRVAVVRLQAVRLAIQGDGTVDVAVCLVDVRRGHGKDVVLGVRLGKGFETGDRIVVAADTAACRAMQRADHVQVGGVGRARVVRRELREQDLRLLGGAHELLHA